MVDTIRPLYKPMLAVSTDQPFDNDAYIFEPKYDGIRCIAYWDANVGTVRLINRPLNDVTERFPDVVNQFKRCALQDSVVLDGELVCFKEGPNGNVPSFLGMQTRMNRHLRIEAAANLAPAEFVAFDILEVNNTPTIDLPLWQRKELLEKLWLVTHSAPWAVGNGKGFARVYKKWEGIMAKQRFSMYTPGKRNSYWQKIKNKSTMVCSILGYTTGEGKRDGYIGALVVGVPGVLLPYYKQFWSIMGKVGTGFDDETLDAVTDECMAIALDNDPTGVVKYDHAAIAVQPGVLWCTVEYSEMTEDGYMRFPSFKGMVNGPELEQIDAST